MSDSSRDPDPRVSTPGTPRWVKVFAAVIGVVFVLFVILLLIKGPGGHGPSRHVSAGDLGSVPVNAALEGW